MAVPELESIGPGMAVRGGGKLIAAGTKDGVDLVVGSQNSLSLPGRFEPPIRFARFRGGLWDTSIRLFKPLWAR